MRDHVGFIQWVYPQTALFYLNLVSGVIGLFIVLIISLRRPNAKSWVRSSWKHCHILLIVALGFDLAIGVVRIFYLASTNAYMASDSLFLGNIMRLPIYYVVKDLPLT